MKALISPSKSRPRRGFTMIELLVVMSIVAVLAGLVAMVASGATEQAKLRRAKVQIKAIEESLEAYKNEYGQYPRPAGGSSDPIAQSKMLYQAVTGDGTNHIADIPPTPSDGNPSTDGKNFLESAFPGSKRGGFVHEDYYLIDPWARPYNYVRGDEDPETYNKTTFDLWTEASRKPNPDEDTWISNWQ